jgi:hypothetical protein
MRKEGLSVRTIVPNKPIRLVKHDSGKRDTLETGKQRWLLISWFLWSICLSRDQRI